MWYDLLILAILIYALIRGAMKGLVWQLAAIAAIVLCFFFAGSASVVIAPHIGLEPPLDRWVSMLFLYFIFSFASFALARGLKEVIEKAKFNDFDRHLGALFGLIKGALFAIVLTFFVVTVYGKSRSYIIGTYSGYYAAVLMDRLHPVMPEGLSEHLEPYIHNLDHDGLGLEHQHGSGHAGEHGTGSPFEKKPGGFSGIDFGSLFGGKKSANTGSEASSSTGQSPFNEGTSGGKQDDPLVGFIRLLPEDLVSDNLRQMMLVAVENTAPEDRTELISKFSTGVPGLMEKVAREWARGKPGTTTSGSPSANSRRDKMLADITGMYGETKLAQRDIRTQIETALQGLPDEVVLSTITDWHADLMGFQTDPDPETSMTTPLDQRILRQLSKARISLNSLTSSLQNRLRASLPR